MTGENMEKITYVDALDYALLKLESLDTIPEYIERLTSMRDSLQNRAGKELERMAVKKKENAAIREEILRTLSEFPNLTITQIRNNNDNLSKYSIQKVCYHVTEMAREGLLIRTMEKRTPTFSIPESDSEGV